MINPITAYFNTGLLPVISCVNRSTVPIGPYSFDKLIATLQKYNDICFSPVWGTPCKLIVSDVVKKGTWGMVFLNDADAANALGYHDLTKDGFPLSKIFTKTTIQSGEKVSVTASHELVEMLIDPAIQMIASAPKGLMYAYEVADAVEAEVGSESRIHDLMAIENRIAYLLGQLSRYKPEDSEYQDIDKELNELMAVKRQLR